MRDKSTRKAVEDTFAAPSSRCCGGWGFTWDGHFPPMKQRCSCSAGAAWDGR